MTLRQLRRCECEVEVAQRTGTRYRTDATPAGDRVTVDPTQADEEIVPAPSEEPKGSPGQNIPGKPISDMDPPGQDEPVGQAEDQGKPSDEDGSTVSGKVPKLRYF
jgi:hypothetical protein